MPAIRVAKAALVAAVALFESLLSFFVAMLDENLVRGAAAQPRY